VFFTGLATKMPISFFCPVCNVKVELPDRLAGKTAQCPFCRNPIDVPAQGRVPAAGRLGRRLWTLLPVLIAAVILAVLIVLLIDVKSSIRALEEDLGSIRRKLADVGAAAKRRAEEPPPVQKSPAPAPAPPRPADATARPAAATDDHATLIRDLTALRDAQEGILAKLRDIEDELAKRRGAPLSAPAPVASRVEIAEDDDIDIKVDVKQDAALPRPKFTFTGIVTNTGTHPAPVVQISIRMTGFQGLDPVTRQPIALVPHSATITERIRSLAPGASANLWKEFSPAEPALFPRELSWLPQFEATARVLRE
jgi:hypothetical protein